MIQRILKYFILLFFFAIFYQSCSNNIFVNPTENNKGINLISGKIENWSYGDSIKIVAGEYRNIYGRGDSLYVFGSAKINPDGSFSLSLSNPSDTLTRRSANGAYTFTDPGAKFTTLKVMLFLPEGSLFKYIYNASNSPQELKTGQYWIDYQYADRTVTMTGEDNGSTSLGPWIIKYNIDYKKGWNRVVEKLISTNNQMYNYECEVSDTSVGKWFISE